MTKTVVGMFDNYVDAQDTVQDLMDSGFQREDISVVANENVVGRNRSVGATDSAAAEGAGAGAGGGPVLGGA
ncbi:MAG: hypothetical protein HGA45_23110, partial [Chloroflexales bacterium]|nr:hypothetical protein [Chloroflexales bacterium]